VDGRDGRFGFLVAVSQRATTAYQAPAGTFGALTLTRPTLVNDAGVRDGNVTAQLAYDAAPGERLTLKVSRYDATEAGFGYVDPRAWGDSSGGRVRLLYPDQRVDRVTASWSHRPAGGRLADRLTVTASASQNTRTFRQEVDIALAPTASLSVRSRNVTDIHGIGVRAEFIKALNAVTLLTYGADWYRDRSLNTDSSLTRVVGFGPTTTRTSLVANVPNATFGTGGVFAQAQVTVGPRLVLGVGTRGQWIDAVTDRTASLPANRSGVRASDRALVGQASAQYALRPGVSLVATTGRAFRAPNLVERYFDGPTSEGNGYQVASPDLTPETSVNVDVGLKVRRPRVLFEVTVFDNAIRDGIRIVPLGTSINRLPAYANENIDRLRDRGVEALGEVQLGRGFSALASLTTLRSDNLLSNNPVGDSYAGKIGAELGWRSISGRLGARYEVRHQRRREDITLVGSPVGDALPAFTVHGVRGDAQLPTVGGVRPSLYIAISNLTNALYAEASNTAFFRPEPPRSLLAALRIDF
jgi:outer membrane receptor protein involved in Fe transport